MTYKRFIDSDYVKEVTTIDKNVDSDFINKFIDVSQETNLIEVIGENLYNKIMADIISNTITGFYKALLEDYLMKCLAWWVKYRSLSEMNIHLTNKGAMVKHSEFSQPVEDIAIVRLRTETLSIIESYEKKIRLFIVRNPNEFPEYYTTTLIEPIMPQRNNYFGGLYLP